MSVTSIISEVFRFLKDKWVSLLIGALIFAVVSVALKVLINENSQSFFAEEAAEAPAQQVEDPKESLEYLTEIYSQEPAEFQLVLQKEDGELFENSFVLDEYFTSEEVVEGLEERTGVDVSTSLSHEKLLGIYKNAEYRGSLAGIRDRSSNVLTLRVLVAESSEDNLKLAQEMQRMLEAGEVPLLEKLHYINISDAAITEHLKDEQLDMVASPAALGQFSTAQPRVSAKDLVLYALLGFILGFLLVAVLLILVQFFKEKIDYAFQYSWGREDVHILVDKDKSDPELWIHQPKLPERVVLSEGTDTELSHHVDEVVLVVESGLTTRDWYNQHYRLAELSKSPIKIVHIY